MTSFVSQRRRTGRRFILPPARKRNRGVAQKTLTSADVCLKKEKKKPTKDYWARPCEKTGPKNQWFKPVISENKSLVRKKLITGL